MPTKNNQHENNTYIDIPLEAMGNHLKIWHQNLAPKFGN
jgi:hypothetical protein